MLESTIFLLSDASACGLMLLADLIGQADVTAIAADGAAQAAGEAADGAAGEAEMSPLQKILFGPWVLPLGLFFLFYATFIAPERRRKAQEAKLMGSLKKGDRIVTIGGIHGTMVSVTPESKVVTIKIDEGGNTRVKINRTAIASVVDTSSENKESKDKD